MESTTASEDLSGMTLEQLLDEGQICVHHLQGKGKYIVRLGRILAHIDRHELFKAAGYQTLGDLTQEKFGFDGPQARDYIKVSVLPPSLVEGKLTSIHKLEKVVDAPMCVWHVMFEISLKLGDLVFLGALANSVTALMDITKATPREAEEYLRRAAKGEIGLYMAGKAPRPERKPRPSDLGKKLTRRLKEAQKATAELAEQRDPDKPFKGQWVIDVGVETRVLLWMIVDGLDLDPEELLRQMRKVPRGGPAGPAEGGAGPERAGPSGREGTKVKDNEGLGTDLARPEGPPAPPASEEHDPAGKSPGAGGAERAGPSGREGTKVKDNEDLKADGARPEGPPAPPASEERDRAGEPPAGEPPAGEPPAGASGAPASEEEAAGSEAATQQPVPAGQTQPAGSEAATQQPAPAGQTQPSGSPPAVQPEHAPADETWEGPVARTVVKYLTIDEKPALAVLLLMALAGRPPVELISFVRDVGARMTGEPDELREHLGFWLVRASCGVLERRWPCIFHFFQHAQLPGFRLYLHMLSPLRLPEAFMPAVKAAWERWPLDLVPPPVIPEGASEYEVRVWGFIHRLRVCQKLYYMFVDVEGEAMAEPLSWIWMEAHHLRAVLDRLPI